MSTTAFYSTLNIKWIQMVTSPTTSRDSERSNRDPNTIIAQYLEKQLESYLATIANY